jgi:D-threonine aldolase
VDYTVNEGGVQPLGQLLSARERLRRLAAQWQPLLRRLATPCLLVDAAAIEQNCECAGASAASRGLTIRPHVKAHKCTELLRRQLAVTGASGVACATVYEAEALAELGFGDVLLANEVVSEAARAALVRAAGAAEEMRIVVDGPAGVACASSAAREAGRTIGVLIDVEVGTGRCGIAPEPRAIRAAIEDVRRHDGLRLDGAMAYDSRGNYASSGERAQMADSVRRAVEGVRNVLAEAGCTDAVVSGGSTGMWDLDQGLTELQLGSYVLMEGRYACTALPFAPAVFCAATVISCRGSDHAVLDCGWKAVSAEMGPPVAPVGHEVVRMADEHTVLRTDVSLEVGDVVLLLPFHLDPTMNLHDRVVALVGDHVEEWEIDLRRNGTRLAGDAH